MEIAAYILTAVAAAVMMINFRMYQNNVKWEHYDGMGAPINFNIGYGLATLFFTLALFLHPKIQWWWGVICLSTPFYLPMVIRPLFHRLLVVLDLAERPRPEESQPPRKLP